MKWVDATFESTRKCCTHLQVRWPSHGKESTLGFAGRLTSRTSADVRSSEILHGATYHAVSPALPLAVYLNSADKAPFTTSHQVRGAIGDVRAARTSDLYVAHIAIVTYTNTKYQKFPQHIQYAHLRGCCSSAKSDTSRVKKSTLHCHRHRHDI